MKVERGDDERSVIRFRKVAFEVDSWVGDFYASDALMPTLRKSGPMRQFVAVLRAYEHIRAQLGHDDDTTFGEMPAADRKTCKVLMTELVARGLQSGLVRYRRPSRVQTEDPAHARVAARSLVETRVAVDPCITGDF
jgi:hypothetical protein